MSDAEIDGDEEVRDIGVEAHVPPSQRRDDDEGKFSNALEDGDDVGSAEAWFDDPNGDGGGPA